MNKPENMKLKQHLNKKRLIIYLNIALVLVIIFLFERLAGFSRYLEILKEFLFPLAVSLFIYYMMRPLVRAMSRKKMARSVAAGIMLLALLAVLVLTVVFGWSVLSEQVTGGFFRDLQQSFKSEAWRENINKNFFGLDISSSIIGFINNLTDSLGKVLMNTLKGAADVGLKIIIVPFAVFYLLKDDKRMASALLRLVPEKNRQNVRSVVEIVDTKLAKYIVCQLTVALVIGVLMFLGYTILGFKSSLFLGFFTLITSIIPFLGAIISVIPGVLIGLTMSPGYGIAVVVMAIIMQQLEGNIITPKIVGDKLKLHPLGVIVIITVCTALFGVLGAFTGVPLYLIISTIIEESVKNRRNRKKEAIEDASES